MIRLVSCTLSNNYAQGGQGGSGNANSNGQCWQGEGRWAVAFMCPNGIVVMDNFVAINNGAKGGHGGRYHANGPGPRNGVGGLAYGGTIYNESGLVSVIGWFVVQQCGGRLRPELPPHNHRHAAVLFIRKQDYDFSDSLFIQNTSVGSDGESSAEESLNDPAHAEGGAAFVEAGSAEFHHVHMALNSAGGWRGLSLLRH